MKDTVFIKVNRVRAISMTQEIPTLQRGEYCICLDIEVDNAWLDDPLPRARVKVGKEDVIAPNLKVSARKRVSRKTAQADMNEAPADLPKPESSSANPSELVGEPNS